MALKRVIDADKICADQFFLHKSASCFRRYQCPGACRLYRDGNFVEFVFVDVAFHQAGDLIADRLA